MFTAIGVAYQRLPVPPELFVETVSQLGAAGFAGANVTIPHKQAALALADEETPRARAIGAANTLTFADGRIAADNTDAPGLLAALAEPVVGQTALVLGAGGSARAVVWALVDAGASDVRVWNRTADRAQRLASELGATAVDGPAVARRADVLVNCTSVGLDAPSETFEQLPLAAADLGGFDTVVDLVYRPEGTALLHAAAARGCAVVDGLEVLVQQGALSYEVWTGKSADVERMRAAVRGA
jgi:shikimate dehydrogenase